MNFTTIPPPPPPKIKFIERRHLFWFHLQFYLKNISFCGQSSEVLTDINVNISLWKIYFVFSDVNKFDFFLALLKILNYHLFMLWEPADRQIDVSKLVSIVRHILISSENIKRRRKEKPV